MKLHSSDLTGTRQVYGFTLRQMLKSKANIFGALIVVMVALLIFPVMSLMGNNGTGEYKDLYWRNETELPITSQIIGEAVGYEGDRVISAQFTAEEAYSRMDFDDALLVFTGSGKEGYKVELYSQKLDANESVMVSHGASALFAAQCRAAGITGEQLAALTGTVTAETGTYEEYVHPTASDFDTLFFVQLFYSIVVMILATLSAGYIVRAVVQEKASKLTDMLLVSVRPLALILGKVLAVMTYVFGLIAAAALSGVASWFLTGRLLPGASGGNLLGALGIDFSNLSLGFDTIAAAVVTLLLTYCTFAAFSALFGVSCSAMEEVESANLKVVLIVMAGYIGACALGAVGDHTLGMVVSYVPILSLFCAPVQYAAGIISFWELAGAWVVQLVLVVLLVRFCAAVYEGLLLHKGDKLKPSTLLSMAFGRGKGGAK